MGCTKFRVQGRLHDMQEDAFRVSVARHAGTDAGLATLRTHLSSVGCHAWTTRNNHRKDRAAPQGGGMKRREDGAPHGDEFRVRLVPGC